MNTFGSSNEKGRSRCPWVYCAHVFCFFGFFSHIQLVIGRSFVSLFTPNSVFILRRLVVSDKPPHEHTPSSSSRIAEDTAEGGAAREYEEGKKPVVGGYIATPQPGLAMHAHARLRLKHFLATKSNVRPHRHACRCGFSPDS